MITIIIFAVIGLIVGISEMTDWFFDSLVDIAVGIIMLLVSIALGAIFGLLVAFLLPAKMEPKIDTYKIVTLQDNNLISGQFFLGSGTIEGKMKYVFYYEEKDNEFRMMQIDYDDASIKYSDIPKVEAHGETPTKAFINKFAVDMEDIKYIIYVPEGTIKTNYNLDAQ